MATFIVLTTGLVSLFIIKNKQRTFFCVSGIFVLTWVVCLGFATLGLFSMNKPNGTVVFLGCASMLIFALVSGVKITLFRTKLCSPRIGLSSNLLLVFLHLAAYIFSFPYLSKSLRLIVSGDFYQVRVNAFEGTAEYASTATLMIFQTLIAPLFVVTFLLAALSFGKGKPNKRLIFLSVLDVLLYTLLFAGRYMILQLMLFLVFATYEKYAGRLFDFLGRRKKIVVIMMLLIGALILMTSLRSDSGFWKSLYTYFCGSFAYLSYLVDNEIGTKLFLLGRTSFGFVFNFINMVLTFLLNTPYIGSNHVVTQLTQHTVRIGEQMSYNSLGTMLHDFMTDFGVYGSLISVVLFACVCNQIERKKRSTDSNFWNALYIYVLFAVVNTVLGYSFRAPATLMIIVYIWLFAGSTRKEEFNNVV